MKTINDTLPTFTLTAVISPEAANAFTEITEKTYAGSWQVYFFWPKDFTFVCPTEIIGFGEIDSELKKRDTQLLGVSTDSEYVHLAWRNEHHGLKNSPFPWLADLKKELSDAFGVLSDEGVAQRATFIVDPEGKIRFAATYDDSVGRNPEEILRVLDALQSGGLCACRWQKGDELLAT